MSASVVVVDYGVGNLLSVCRALESCGANVELSPDPNRVQSAERVVLPGVGAFGDCVSELKKRHFDTAVLRFIATGRPLLGICVGMQMLLDSSEEFGEHAGLGLIPGRVKAIPNTTAEGKPHKIPHIAWSALGLPESRVSWEGTMLAELTPGDACYFLHSFAPSPANPAHALAMTNYNGRAIYAAVQKDNITGVQFHPEKSGTTGLTILNGFLSGI